MTRSLNPFNALYLTESVRSVEIPLLFSPVLVPFVSELYQPGNVVIRGMQGTGKSMLLALLETGVRQAFWEAEQEGATTDGIPRCDPIPVENRRFVGAAINLSTSRATKLNEIVASKHDRDENIRLTQAYFGDYLNCWVLKDLLSSLELLITKAPAERRREVGVTDDPELLSDALRIMADDAPCCFLQDHVDAVSARRALEKRMRAYLSLLSNPRKSLSEEIDETRSLLGEPLTVAANALRASGVIASDVHVFVTIDQFETLLRQSQDDRDDQKHRRFVNLVFDLLASRNPAVSYRVGTRPNAVMKLSDAARDYAEVDLDEILQRTESGRKKFWPFQRVAHDAFRRRIAAIETPYRDTIVSSANAIRDVFGASPSNHDRGNDCASRKPERVVKLEDTWDEAVCEVLESMALEDPVSAKLAEAWIRQRTARGEDLSAGNWATAEHRPWETHQKRWWKKERLPQASLQVASSNAQRLVYYGEEDILSLSGENILAFICICRSIWECDARFRTEHSGDNDTTQFPFEPKQQAQGIWEASEFWHRKIPQSADGDTLQRLVDVIGQRLNQQLISDRAMSYPGANGFSLAVDDLCGDPEIKRLLDDATAECLLLQRAHTPKTKSRGRSIKWYPHPILAPFYGLTVPRTKEPLYVSVATLRQWLVTGSVLAADESASNKHESEAKSSKLNPKDDQGTESAPRPSEHSTSDRQKTFRFSEDHDD